MKLVAKIPTRADLLVSVGQEVDYKTPLYRTNTTDTISINVAQLLNFSPDKIFMNLKKLVGDSILPGDLLAEHKTVFATKQYFSEHTGTIKEINHQTGGLVIEVASDKKNVANCFFKGEITGVAEGALEFKVKHAKEYNINPSKEYFGAPVFYLEDEKHTSLTDDDVENKCVCDEKVHSYELIKIEALDAKAIITTSAVPNASLPIIVLQKPEDFATIKEHHYPNCIMGVEHNTIVFYE